jgi:hypothetical protein
MSKTRTTVLLLAGMTLACGAYAGEPAGTTQGDSGMSGRIKAVDAVTGKSRQPTAAEVAALRSRAANMKTSRGLKMPRTNAEASRMITVRADGTERLPASEESLSTLVQVRQADGTFVTAHADADDHAAAASQAKEKASE